MSTIQRIGSWRFRPNNEGVCQKMGQAFTFMMPMTNVIGPGAANQIVDFAKQYQVKKALLVTDEGLFGAGVVKKFTNILDEGGVSYVIFKDVQPNPSIENVHNGLDVLKKNECDFVISLGGGSPQDCAKGIALVATNGGRIEDYNGINLSKVPQMTLFAVNTTAGTSSEITKNAVITNEQTKAKMVIIDQNITPTVGFNDPLFMLEKPKGLTAATGMDCLTHAVEAYVAAGANPVTDPLALAAIKLISENLRAAVQNGKDVVARENMVYANVLAGMSFNTAGLGYVHAMAHPLGGVYGLPHGVCNAILLPVIEEFNSVAVPEKFADIAKAMGENVDGLSVEEAAQAAIKAIRKLSQDVGIPSGLKELGVKEEDLEMLTDFAMNDVCAGGNPRVPTKQEVIDLYKKAF